ncbi:hypothetical protein D1007_48676 [Hordeum vulgare]|nr:hypothetical protein D1007_48676 [Hordeum vulgare]
MQAGGKTVDITDALRVAIQLSECQATKEATSKAKAVSHAKEQDCLLCTLSGMWCSSDEDDNDTSTYGFDDDDSNDAPPHADAYTEEGHNRVDDRKGKGGGEEMVISFVLRLCAYILCDDHSVWARTLGYAAVVAPSYSSRHDARPNGLMWAACFSDIYFRDRLTACLLEVAMVILRLT